MANLKPDKNAISQILQNLTNDSVDITGKIYYEFNDKSSDSYINDSNYDAVPAINVDNLEEEDIYNFAEAAYLKYQLSRSSSSSKSNNSTMTNSASEGTSSDSSDSSSKNKVDEVFDKVNAIKNKLSDGADDLSSYLTDILSQKGMDGFAGTLSSILSVVSDGLADYQDGVSETNFGEYMEGSWSGNTNSFLNYFNTEYSGVAAESRKINILASTPLDPGDSRSSLFGTMIMGTPYTFNNLADPHNRILINSFIKDGKILSLTPGMPKYNGLTSYTNIQNSILNQTESPNEMLNYLVKNGLDKSFSEKDKRYYTFEAKYDDYFAYLETMLNAVWIKMGLAKNGEQFNIFSFFNIKQEAGGGINPEQYKNLKPQYNSSIGFFTNIASSVSESVDSQTTSTGADLASRANSNSAEYQKLNYISGMGTGGSAKNVSRSIGIGINTVSQIKGLIGETFNATSSALSNFNSKNLATTIASTAKLAVGIGTDIINFNNTQDIGAVVQSFATSNGMMVKYPELWSDSSYSKNINFNFTFTSPYGDPLSIFKYVYVPFFALACFSLPRQAAENGYVSPFFVRADVPGLVTSDLAMITSFTWTKGGSNSLWTKDGLPRTIECSITLTDLYPYLSMTKRLSFLSANPSYTVFLDNMTGMCALHDNTSDDILNEYFKNLIDRVNGTSSARSGLWNKFNSSKISEALRTMNSKRGSVSGTIMNHSIP